MNDYQFKLVKIEGQFGWYEHNGTDEVFIFSDGSMTIECKYKTVTLKEGEMIVVEKGEQHKPFAFEECKVIPIEPRGIIDNGDSVGNLTSENDIWIWNRFVLCLRRKSHLLIRNIFIFMTVLYVRVVMKIRVGREVWNSL